MSIKSEKIKKLSSLQIRKSGRAQGNIVLLHRGGGRKRRYRFLDFKRDRFPEEKALLKNLYKDPFRSPLIGTLLFGNGYISQIILAEGSKKDDIIYNDLNLVGSFQKNPLSSSMRLKNIQPGTIIFGVEFYPGSGQRIARAAGTSAVILKGEFMKNYRRLKLKSGEIRLIHKECLATIGVTNSQGHFLKKLEKAGTNRWLSRRPRVRAYAMNPVDHPMGGRTKGGSPAKNRKGLLSTRSNRNNPKTERFILLGHRKRKSQRR
jgi:large subunit ribosomal protein L2